MPVPWQRHPNNPIIAPDPKLEKESKRCMTPCVVRVANEIRLYYAAGGRDDTHRICLATARSDRPFEFTRHGAILEPGEPGGFDAHWCVLPLVHKFGGVWHLYYSGHEGTNLGLQSFSGIGLATSIDGIHFT